MDRLRAWAPAVLWAVFIYCMSTDDFSGAHTRSWVEKVVLGVFPGTHADTIDVLNEMLRRIAHVSEYFVFVLLLDRALAMTAPSSRAPAPVRAFAIAVLYSFSDEAHQLFVPSRSARLADCGFDSFGAAIGAALRLIGLSGLRW